MPSSWWHVPYQTQVGSLTVSDNGESVGILGPPPWKCNLYFDDLEFVGRSHEIVSLIRAVGPDNLHARMLLLEQIHPYNTIRVEHFGPDGLLLRAFEASFHTDKHPRPEHLRMLREFNRTMSAQEAVTALRKQLGIRDDQEYYDV